MYLDFETCLKSQARPEEEKWKKTCLYLKTGPVRPTTSLSVLSIYSSRGMNIFGNTVIDVCQEYLQRIYIQPLPHNSLLYNCPQQQQKQQLNLNVFSRSTKFSSSKSMFMQKKSCFPPKTACWSWLTESFQVYNFAKTFAATS